MPHVPLVWYPRLLQATAAQRQNWELLGDGEGIHWPDVDEDLSAKGFYGGARLPKRAGRQQAADVFVTSRIRSSLSTHYSWERLSDRFVLASGSSCRPSQFS